MLLIQLFLSTIASVEGGHRAVIFDRFTGIKTDVVGEGTHFFIPWVQRPIMYDIRSRPRNVPVITGSKGTTNNHLMNHSFQYFLLHFYGNRFTECKYYSAYSVPANSYFIA